MKKLKNSDKIHISGWLFNKEIFQTRWKFIISRFRVPVFGIIFHKEDLTILFYGKWAMPPIFKKIFKKIVQISVCKFIPIPKSILKDFLRISPFSSLSPFFLYLFLEFRWKVLPSQCQWRISIIIVFLRQCFSKSVAVLGQSRKLPDFRLCKILVCNFVILKIVLRILSSYL